MATTAESNPCSICAKPSAKFLCTGCKKYFCSKHFKEHEEQLSTKFDHDIVRSHEELLDGLQMFEKSSSVSSDLFDRIEQWRKATVEKVEKAAEQARHRITELLIKKRTKIAEKIQSVTKEVHCCRDEEDFVESDIDRLRKKINEIRYELEQFTKKDAQQIIVIGDDQIDWDKLICIDEVQNSLSFVPIINLNANTKWKQNGATVIGGHGHGSERNQLNHPWGLFVDDNHTIYIAEYSNHRITEWKLNATQGNIVVGGNGQGNRHDQLNYPTDVIVDKVRDSLIVSDYNNRRVVRWPRENNRSGETIINDIGCLGLAMDDYGFLYVVDHDEHAVKRYRVDDSQGTIVAGGNGPGDRLDQLYYPRYIFVDREQSIYVSEYENHRVVKWTKDAKQGIVVAGGQGQGHGLNQLSNPYGIIVDQQGILYVADYANHRIMRWIQGDTHGSVVVGRGGHGSRPNQLHGPIGLFFDREGNLYVSDNENHRIQKFDIEQN